MTDSANQYGQEMAEVVRSNFYMDGLLKCNVQHVQWDDVVGPELKNDWERWEHKLKGVEDIHISSCIKPHMFGKIIKISLHHFLDASEKRYGQCSYIKLVNGEGKIHCGLLVSKS